MSDRLRSGIEVHDDHIVVRAPLPERFKARRLDVVDRPEHIGGRERVFTLEHPCVTCAHMVIDFDAVYGRRCLKGETSDQCSDFSCYQLRGSR